ncbi:hypothetical protein ScPMuIL_018582 [Solemya velum]
MSRGALIVFEGCDKSGKTTQCNKLVKSLTDYGAPTELMKFPDRTTAIGKLIDEYLSNKTEVEDHAIHLLFSANRWESVKRMQKLLDSGTTLIIDRYAFSGVAFTAAKQGFDIDWCKQPDVGLPRPDAVFYLNLGMEAASKRQSYGEERYEKLEFQTKVAKNFQLLADPSYWKTIDADKTVDDLHKELYNLTKTVIEEVKNQPIKTLWTNVINGD